jgi:hypothetical protein
MGYWLLVYAVCMDEHILETRKTYCITWCTNTNSGYWQTVPADSKGPARVQWIATQAIPKGEELFGRYDRVSIMHPGVELDENDPEALLCNAELLLRYAKCFCEWSMYYINS